MSRLASNRNVQWSEEGAIKWVYPRAQTWRTHLVSDQDILMKELKRWRKIFLRKMKKCISGRNQKASYFMTETLIVLRVAYIARENGFVSIFSCEKNQLQVGEKWKKFRNSNSLLYLLEKIQSEKNSAVIFRLKHSLQRLRKTNETMNPIYFVSVMRYSSSS